MTLLEIVFVMGLVTVLAAIAVPQSLADIERAKTAGAARYLAARFSLARTQAVARGANVAVLLAGDAAGVSIGTHRDGNGNGVRTAEVLAGIDPSVDTVLRLTDLFPGVTVAVNDPAAVIAPGSTTLMSFSAVGTASSGTIYFQGRGPSQYAVRVLGATGRTRVLRYLAPKDLWVPVF